jgi:hypothetical protein
MHRAQLLGQVTVMASGTPVSPSQHTKHASATPRDFSPDSTVSQIVHRHLLPCVDDAYPRSPQDASQVPGAPSARQREAGFAR